jgi:TRIAD3 protein (E3 ubiquitin-protein ligase RNF216)
VSKAIKPALAPSTTNQLSTPEMAPPQLGLVDEVIDLTSEDGDLDEIGLEVDDFAPHGEFDLNEYLNMNQPTANNSMVDLTGLEDIPDIDVPPDAAGGTTALQEGYIEEGETIGEAMCLQMILDVLPEIAVNHVLELINEQQVYTTAACERLITKLLDEGLYPKERDELHRKRKRGSSDSQEEKVEDATNAPDYLVKA